MTLSFTLLALNFVSTTYGYGELMCGDIGKAQPCNSASITASGEQFDPQKLTAAVPMPSNRIMRPFNIYLMTYKGKCVKVRVNDKKHPRFIGSGGLDLSPATVKAITGKYNSTWSGKVKTCQPK